MTKRFFLSCLGGLFLLGLSIGYVGLHTNLDLGLADGMYDAALKDFPARNTWFAADFMHRWVKYALIAIGLSLTGFLAADMARARKRLTDAQRRKLAVVVLAFLLIPLVISTLKSQSMHHCPWDLQRYGGFAPYLRLFDALPPGVRPGHCFPAGHASSGLWTAAFCVFWLPQRRGAALGMFALGLLPGLMLGWVQQLRGAHFLTHTLWSAWIAGLIILLLSGLLLRQRG